MGAKFFLLSGEVFSGEWGLVGGGQILFLCRGLRAKFVSSEKGIEIFSGEGSR